MIFRSPSNAQTKLAETDGTPVLFWRNWFNAVAQWLTEASTVQQAESLAWSAQGCAVFVSWSGDAGSVTFGRSRGNLPAPTRAAIFTQADGSTLAVTPGATVLNFTQPTQGWYFAEGQ